MCGELKIKSLVMVVAHLQWRAKSGTSSPGKKKALSQVTGPVRSALAGADKMKVLINKEAQSSRSSKALDVVHPF